MENKLRKMVAGVVILSVIGLSLLSHGTLTAWKNEIQTYINVVCLVALVRIFFEERRRQKEPRS